MFGFRMNENMSDTNSSTCLEKESTDSFEGPKEIQTSTRKLKFFDRMLRQSSSPELLGNSGRNPPVGATADKEEFKRKGRFGFRSRRSQLDFTSSSTSASCASDDEVFAREHAHRDAKEILRSCFSRSDRDQHTVSEERLGGSERELSAFTIGEALDHPPKVVRSLIFDTKYNRLLLVRSKAEVLTPATLTLKSEVLTPASLTRTNSMPLKKKHSRASSTTVKSKPEANPCKVRAFTISSVGGVPKIQHRGSTQSAPPYSEIQPPAQKRDRFGRRGGSFKHRPQRQTSTASEPVPDTQRHRPRSLSAGRNATSRSSTASFLKSIGGSSNGSRFSRIASLCQRSNSEKRKASKATLYTIADWLKAFGRRMRILVIGSHKVGKSAIIRHFIESDLSDGSQTGSGTEGSNGRRVSVLLDGEESMLDFVERQIILRSYEDMYGSEIYDAYVVVYSVTDAESFSLAVDVMSVLSKTIEAKDSAKILVANKADIVRLRHISEEEGKSKAVLYNCKFIEVSAIFEHKLDELLVGIVKQTRLRLLVKILKKIKLKDDKNDSKRKNSVCSGSQGEDVGCIDFQQAREFVGKIFGGSNRRGSRSCDNLLVL